MPYAIIVGTSVAPASDASHTGAQDPHCTEYQNLNLSTQKAEEDSSGLSSIISRNGTIF